LKEVSLSRLTHTALADRFPGFRHVLQLGKPPVDAGAKEINEARNMGLVRLSPPLPFYQLVFSSPLEDYRPFPPSHIWRDL